LRTCSFDANCSDLSHILISEAYAPTGIDASRQESALTRAVIFWPLPPRESFHIANRSVQSFGCISTFSFSHSFTTVRLEVMRRSGRICGRVAVVKSYDMATACLAIPPCYAIFHTLLLWPPQSCHGTRGPGPCRGHANKFGPPHNPMSLLPC
jgi:hypothetical protein